MLTKLHDYTKIIQKPLDLYTIYFRILRGEYKLPDEFVDDIKTMINNAKIYFIHYSSILTDVLRF